MRTTLTLDPDVALLLQRLCQERQVSFKHLINQALREGLRQLETPAPATPFHTPTAALGRCLLGSLDDIAEALALAEGEAFQ
jgi:hypothetical protein